MTARFNQMAAVTAELLPDMHRVGIIGSASWFDPESEYTCVAIGDSLAKVRSLALVTGGRSGVGETVARTFFQAHVDEHREPHVYHLLPDGCEQPDYGETLFCGRNMVERREVLGRIATVYIAVEGGPGTEYEAMVALSNKAKVIPVGRSGGYSQRLYRSMAAPDLVSKNDWIALGADAISPGELANAVRMIVIACLNQ